MSRRPGSIPELVAWLAERAYLADRGLATALYLSLVLGQPLLVEGEAGVGKTEVAKALADALGAELVRLQCYEGIDAGQALYEWDYARQLVYLRSLREGAPVPPPAGDPVAAAAPGADVEAAVFGPRFLLERPLLAAIRRGDAAVLLVDEVDRADEEFEAFLLEVLSDFQVSVPEIGTIRAAAPPVVVLTSNRTRELHDALKRRCLYHWIDFPDAGRETEIVLARAPEVGAGLAAAVVSATHRLRELDLVKRPGVAETIAWARALAALGARADPAGAADTIGAVLKDRDDVRSALDRLPWVLGGG